MTAMAAAPKRLRIGDVVEVDGRLYDVVSNKAGGVALEAAITVTADELDRHYGTRPATQEEIDSELGLLPPDGEG